MVSEQKERSRAGGRPEYKPTAEQRAEVKRLAGLRVAKTVIAKAIGISRITLRKHFAQELGLPSLETAEPTLALEGAHAPVKVKEIGRPEFEPTLRQREDVKLWKADDWSDDRIATQLGISRNTLLKHFAEELDYGVDHVRTRNLRNLQRAADAGNVSACREMLQLKGMLAPAERLPSPPPENEAPTLGKKETALLKAKTAEEGTSWATVLKH